MSADGTLRSSGQADEMTIDLEDSSAMEVDKENEEGPKKRCPENYLLYS